MIKGDPEKVVIDFAESRVADQSGIEAIRKINEKYAAAGKFVSFKHLSHDCTMLLENVDVNVEIDPSTDPEYTVVYNA